MLHIWKKSTKSKVRANDDITREKRDWKRWSDDEIDYIIKNYHKKTAGEISEVLGRTEVSIRGMVRRLKEDKIITDNKHIPLSDKDKRFIRRVAERWNVNQISVKLGRSYHSVARYVDELRDDGVIGEDKMAWSDEDIEFLKDNHKKMTTSQLSKKLGKSYGRVYYRLKVLGLI